MVIKGLEDGSLYHKPLTIGALSYVLEVFVSLEKVYV
jgi:hypothetical protein